MVRTDKAWSCVCHDGHFITLYADEKWGSFGIQDGWRIYEDGLIARMKDAWRLLRRGKDLWTEIELTPETAREIATELNILADKIDVWTKEHVNEG